MNRDVGSMYREDITPGRGGPGTIRKGTEEPLKADVSRRSYKRRISCEALHVVRFLGSRILEREVEEVPYQTKCRPLGIALTQLTGPLPLGNFNDRSDSHPEFALCMLNSSTVLLRRPA
jgi:hypothetical protein